VAAPGGTTTSKGARLSGSQHWGICALHTADGHAAECGYGMGRVARCPVFDRTVRFLGELSGQKYDAKPDN